MIKDTSPTAYGEYYDYTKYKADAEALQREGEQILQEAERYTEQLKRLLHVMYIIVAVLIGALVLHLIRFIRG